MSIGFCFVVSKDADDDMCPVLTIYDDSLETIWDIPVQAKGAISFVVEWCVGVFELSVYSNTDITLNSDQEPAIWALKVAVAAERFGKTALIASPVRESRAIGAVENAARRWQGKGQSE